MSFLWNHDLLPMLPKPTHFKCFERFCKVSIKGMFGVSELGEGAVLINWALCGGMGGGSPELAPYSLWVISVHL